MPQVNGLAGSAKTIKITILGNWVFQFLIISSPNFCDSGNQKNQNLVLIFLCNIYVDKYLMGYQSQKA